tara:strand:+ start:1995 stop:2231 length:237 start_codon:yes stop_codon:yes gene_type:complete
MSRTFVILDADEVVNINFNEVIEDSAETLRFSLNGDKTFVKFEGDTPDFLVGKTTNTHSEMLAILQTEEWTEPVDPPE